MVNESYWHKQKILQGSKYDAEKASLFCLHAYKQNRDDLPYLHLRWQNTGSLTQLIQILFCSLHQV